MLVGYARVSSLGQSLEVQMEKLRHCERIYAEKRSGTVTSVQNSGPASTLSERVSPSS